jgi:DNA-binding CsgD family transcriptional regulator
MPGNALTAHVAIAGVARDADTPAVFGDAVMGELSGVMPFDGYAFFGTDPLNGLRTFTYSRHALDGVAEHLAHNEFVEVDANRYRDLAAATRPIGVMTSSHPTGRGSPRMVELLRPAGFGSELRLILRSAGRVFGGMSLFRGLGAHPFSDAEVDRTLALAGVLCDVIRRHPIRPAPPPTTALPSGLILIDSSNRVVAQTAAADRWLDELCVGGADEMVPADHMRMILDVTNASRAACTAVVSRIRTGTGRWLLVEAAQVDAFPAEIAVTLRTADLGSLLPAAAAWYGLTRREREVFQAIAHGLPAKHIARDLRLAIPTVNAHLQSIYRKAGVTGREQLFGGLT